MKYDNYLTTEIKHMLSFSYSVYSDSEYLEELIDNRVKLGLKECNDILKQSLLDLDSCRWSMEKSQTQYNIVINMIAIMYLENRKSDIYEALNEEITQWGDSVRQEVLNWIG